MMSDLKIGRLRERLTLEEAMDEPDGAGGIVRRWEARERVWGRLEALPSAATLEAGRSGQRVTHRITIRKREGLTLAHRLRLGTAVHQPRSFHTIGETGCFVAIMTEEIAG